MKKLLLFSSLMLLLFAVACKNTKSTSNGDAADKAAKPIEAKTATTGGSPIEGQSGAGVSIGTNGGVPKDSVKSSPVRGIQHGSPDQIRLDSIKAAKAKIK